MLGVGYKSPVTISHGPRSFPFDNVGSREYDSLQEMMKTAHSAPQSPERTGESRRANTPRFGSTRIEGSLQVLGGFFKGHRKEDY